MYGGGQGSFRSQGYGSTGGPQSFGDKSVSNNSNYHQSNNAGAPGGFSFSQAYDVGSSQTFGGNLPAGSQGQRRGRSIERNILPVTIRQLIKASQRSADTGFQIDGTEFALASIVGRVVGVSEVSTYASVRVHDKYGGIECRLHLTSSEGANAHQRFMLDACQDNRFIRVIGSLKQFQNRKYLTVQSIRPVTNYNEVIMHFFTVVAHHLKATRGPPNLSNASRLGNEMAMGHTKTINQTSTSNVPSYNNMPMTSAHNAQSSGPGASSAGSDFGDPVLNAMIQVMKRSEGQSGDGLKRSFVYAETLRVLRKQIDEESLAASLDWLVNEGYIYSTFDDDHFNVA